MTDSMIMLRRNLRHAQRYPGMTISGIAMPILMLLLFVFVFGGALGGGLGAEDYIDYVTPGIILMAATSGSMATAVGVCVDMTEGIINRFRTMAITRSSVLTGHVIGGVIQTMVSVLLVIGVAVLCGFRPAAGVAGWAGALGLLALLTFALTWVAAAFGLVCKTPESASNAALPLQFLPFLGSAIVTPESMPAGIRWFAEYQPFTPIIETLRGLLMGTPVGTTGLVAVGWCLALALGGYLWARTRFNR
ncbi:ABC transporter permease [Nonomuraea sp. NPDC050556]|uniref:ABC transporter permease n=1 Tax=Nonomuraea sp. NPDC050556 TaxID=3364369 RepID=UPI00378D9065